MLKELCHRCYIEADGMDDPWRKYHDKWWKRGLLHCVESSVNPVKLSDGPPACCRYPVEHLVLTPGEVSTWEEAHQSE